MDHVCLERVGDIVGIGEIKILSEIHHAKQTLVLDLEFGMEWQKVGDRNQSIAAQGRGTRDVPLASGVSFFGSCIEVMSRRLRVEQEE